VLTPTITVGSSPWGIAITPATGQFAYVANQVSGSVSVIDTATNTVVSTLSTGGTNTDGVAVTPDGQYVYVGNNGTSTVSVISTATNTITSTISGAGSGTTWITFTPNGQFAYVTALVSNRVSVIDTALALTDPTHAVVDSIALANPGPLAITLDGRFAYAPGGGVVNVIDTATNTVVNTITAGANPNRVVITPDGKFAYVLDNVGNAVYVIDTSTNTVVGTPIPVGSNPFTLAFTPDGQFAYVTSNVDGTVSVINTATHTVVNTIAFSRLTGIAITPDGKFAYVGIFGATSTTVAVIALGTTLTANLPGGAQGTAYTGSATATDPSGSTFTYAVTAGSLPAGVTLDPNTGAITGTPTTAGNYAFTVTATATPANSINGLNEAIVQPFNLTVLPPGTNGTAYTGAIDVLNDSGASAITCALTTGSSLPPGVTMTTNTTANSCDLSGTPTAPGTYSFGVTTTSTVNGEVQTSTQLYTIVVATPPALTAGQSYTNTPTVPHDTGTTFSCAVTDGALPAGVTLNTSTCQISGTPTDAGVYPFTITTTSTVGGKTKTGIQPYTLVVNPPNGTVGVGYTDVIPVPHDVSTTFTCTVKDGALPPGVTLNASTCQLSGTPTTPGTYNFTITSTSTVGGVVTSTDQAYTIVVRAASAASIPTLSGMALLLLALLLGASAVAVKRRGY
jgi:YVTN family beta-propeller protein